MTRILAVDDQPKNLRLVREVLKLAGFDIREARSGAEALAMAQETPPDLILLDMHLPDMHGLEVLRRLREAPWGAGLRVVAMSAAASPEDRIRWEGAGCLGTIEKPIVVKTFRREISRWLPGAPPPGAAPPEAEKTEKPEAEKRKGDGLGEILLAHSLITPEKLQTAVTAQAESGKRLAQVLVEQGAVSEDDIAWALSNQLGYPYIFLTRGIIDDEAVRLLPENFLRERRILPVLKSGEEMRLAMADPTDQRTVDEVVSRTRLQVNRSLALASNINEMLDRLFSPRDAVVADRAPVTPEAQHLQFHLVQALHQGASEIHFDPAVGQGRVRYRLQGTLVDRASLPADLHGAVLRHLRALTDLGETPVGTTVTTVPIGDVETRVVVSFLPTLTGPAATVTLYPFRTEVPDLAALGVDARNLQALRGKLKATRGVILVGCGDPLLRSTLLHALVPSSPQSKAWALETLPIHRRPTLNQTIVESADYAGIYLQAAARAGADLILIDDVSRREALVAAHEIGRTRLVLAGHPQDEVVYLLGLVLEAAGPALVASTLEGILAARGARMLCPECKEPATQNVGTTERQTFSARGCEACSFTGFRGYRVLTEVWVAGAESRQLLRSGASRMAVEHAAKEVGAAMREQGQALLQDGLTSVEELSRIVDGL